MLNSCRWISLVAGAGLLVALVAGPVAPARAQESAANPAPRDFGGHLFLPSTVVPDPFISTTFTNATGFGKAVNLVIPIYNLDGEKIGETSSDIGFMGLEFGYRQAVSRRVALRLAASGSGRLGTSAEAIVSEGLSAVYGYELGAKVSLLRKSAWQLSAAADLRGNTLYGVSPLAFVQAVVNEIAAGTDTTSALEAGKDSLLTKGNNKRIVGGVSAAYTPAPWIGFTGFLELGLGEKFQKGSDNTSVANFGATVSFDLNPLKRIPIGLLGAFRNESLSEKSDNIASQQTWSFGIFYTGRRFLSLGLETFWARIGQARTDEKIDVARTQVAMRYDFN